MPGQSGSEIDPFVLAGRDREVVRAVSPALPVVRVKVQRDEMDAGPDPEVLEPVDDLASIDPQPIRDRGG